MNIFVQILADLLECCKSYDMHANMTSELELMHERPKTWVMLKYEALRLSSLKAPDTTGTERVNLILFVF